MTKKVLLFVLLLVGFSTIAQKAQRIAYIDMEYILQNIPEYQAGQSQINAKAQTWQTTIDKQQKEIDELKANLVVEKALLTKDLLAEKEEDIQIKEFDLKKLQDAYFGVKGDLYFLRQQLVQPIQDLVYNAIQDIATKRRFDFVFDNSTDLVMLFTNKEYNISDLVLKEITRDKKIQVIEEKQNKRNKEATNQAVSAPVNEIVQQNLDNREAKKEELKKKIEEKRAEQLKKREELLKVIKERRQKKLEELEAAKKAKEEKKKNN